MKYIEPLFPSLSFGEEGGGVGNPEKENLGSTMDQALKLSAFQEGIQPMGHWHPMHQLFSKLVLFKGGTIPFTTKILTHLDTFVAVITFFPFLLCRYFCYQLIVCALR